MAFLIVRNCETKSIFLQYSKDIGIFNQTFVNTFRDISKFCEDENNRVTVYDAVQHFPFPTSGPNKYIKDPIDVQLFQNAWNHRNDSGAGIGTHAMKSNIKQFLNAKAENIIEQNNGESTKESDRLKGAKLGKKYIKNTFRNHESNVLNTSSIKDARIPILNKVSSISIKRARASDPTITSTMARKFIAADNALIMEGKIPTTGWTSLQVANLDEIGFDPDGNHGRVFSMKETGKSTRKFLVKSGEHAVFWVSVVLIITANGELLKPIIIHQGGSETEMPGHFLLNLDKTFHLNCTQSGYADRETYRIVSEILNSYRIDKNLRNMVVYQDAHDSHWDHTALKFMLDNGIYPRFTNAHNSINNQPLDMGVNGMFAQEYERAYGDWKLSNPFEPMSPSKFNGLISKAYNELQKNPKLSSVIIDAFCNAKLYPLVDPLPDDSFKVNEQNKKLCIDSNVGSSSSFGIKGLKVFKNMEDMNNTMHGIYGYGEEEIAQAAKITNNTSICESLRKYCTENSLDDDGIFLAEIWLKKLENISLSSRYTILSYNF